MKNYLFTIISKNKVSKFYFVSLILQSMKQDLYFLKKHIRNKNKKKAFTILKSPHVNKKAQDQFELNFFSSSFEIYASQNFRLLKTLKKMQLNIFPDVRLKTMFLINNKRSEKSHHKIFNINLFKLTRFSKTFVEYNFLKKMKTFLKILDISGEVIQKFK